MNFYLGAHSGRVFHIWAQARKIYPGSQGAKFIPQMQRVRCMIEYVGISVVNFDTKKVGKKHIDEYIHKKSVCVSYLTWL